MIPKLASQPGPGPGRVCSVLAALGLLACGGSQGAIRPSPDTGSGGTAPDDSLPIAVNIDTASRFQTMEGFGGAVVFYANYLADHPNRSEISDVIFRDLGLDILRVANSYQDRVVDEPTVANVAAATTSLGHAPRLLMSSWSPPASLKSNGNTMNGGTLIQQNGTYAYDPFAEWWADALQAYAARGVRPDYVSIQNEPDFVASWASCLLGPTEVVDAVDGGVAVAGYDKALDAVYARFQGLSPPPSPMPVLIGPEVSGLGGPLLQRYLAAMNAGHFGGVAHHLYSGGMASAPETFNATLVTASTLAAGKPLLMTEFAPLSQDMFTTAWLINNAVTVEGVSAYVYWDLTWQFDPSSLKTGGKPSGLVAIETPYDRSKWTTARGYVVHDPYYALKHFARWVDVGWTRIAAAPSSPTVKVSAFLSPDGTQVTAVLLNTSAMSRDVTLTTGDWTFSTSQVFRTSGATERTAEIGPLATGGVVTLPSRSIATVTFAQ